MGSDQFVNLQLAIGIVAVIGHVFPIYERFKGGKGVTTLLGVVIAVLCSCSYIFFVLAILIVVEKMMVMRGN